MAPSQDPRQLDRRESGRIGEHEVESWCKARGWRIVGRNVRVGRGELDVIALDRRTLIFAEVKTREHGQWAQIGALGSLGPRKQLQVRRLASAWLATKPAGLPQLQEIRFDAFTVAIRPDRKVVAIEHIPGAF